MHVTSTCTRHFHRPMEVSDLEAALTGSEKNWRNIYRNRLFHMTEKNIIWIMTDLIALAKSGNFMATSQRS